MILLVFLLAAMSDQSPDAQSAVGYALANLNNYIAAISFSDACLHRSDMQALEPLQDRIEQVRRRALTAYPALTGTEAAGDADYVCLRTSEPQYVSKQAIRRKVTQFIGDVEATLALEGANVR